MIFKKPFGLIITFIMLLSLFACSGNSSAGYKSARSSPSLGQIYLYGEQHGSEKTIAKEFEQWCEYYHNENMRHLFIEAPYYSAAFLNIWMQSESDDILEEVHDDLAGTAAHNPYTLEFYKNIKNECPETVFHGTDVGHQYDTTGERYLRYLESNNLKDSQQYLLAQEAIEQGKRFYEHEDFAYRENKMVENFIREFDSLKAENVMGIYGVAHTGLEIKDYSGSIPCMANQLKQRYGDAVFSEDLSWIEKDIEPERTDKITVGETEYEASYFGTQELTGFKNYIYREFWRLENAYDNFKDYKKTGNVLPYNNFPMLIETGQVFVIDYTKTDDSVERQYYRSDGHIWEGMPSTEEFKVAS